PWPLSLSGTLTPVPSSARRERGTVSCCPNPIFRSPLPTGRGDRGEGRVRVLALALVLVAACGRGSAGEGEGAAVPAVVGARTERATVRPFTQEVTAIGVVEARPGAY